MFFPTLPRHGSPATMVRFAANRREGTAIPSNQSSDVEDDGFQHSSNRAGTPEEPESKGLAGILKKTFSGFTLPSLSAQTEEPAESSVKPRRARFEPGKPYLRQRISTRKLPKSADAKTSATTSKAKAAELEGIEEGSDSDGHTSAGESLFAKSVRSLRLDDDPPTLPSPLGDTGNLGRSPHRSAESSTLATKFPSQLPSAGISAKSTRPSSRRQTVSMQDAQRPNVQRPNVQRHVSFQELSASSDSEDQAGLTDSDEMSTDTKALYAEDNSSSSGKSGSEDEQPLHVVRGFAPMPYAERREPLTQQPAVIVTAEEGMLSKGIKGAQGTHSPRKPTTKRSMDLAEYREAEAGLRKKVDQEALDASHALSQALNEKLSKLSPRNLGKLSLRFEYELLGNEARKNNLFNSLGLTRIPESETGGIDEARAELESQRQALTKDLDELEQHLPFKLKGLTEQEIDEKLQEYISKHPKHAKQFDAHKDDLFVRRQQLMEKLAKLDALEGKYQRLLVKGDKIDGKIGVYRAFRHNDILGQLEDIPENSEERDILKAHLASNYTLPEMLGVKKELQEKARESQKRNDRMHSDLQHKDRQLSQQFLSEDGDSEPEYVTPSVARASTRPARRNSSERLRRSDKAGSPKASHRMAKDAQTAQDEQLTFLDSIIRRQMTTRDNIFTQVNRYLKRYVGQDLKEPVEKLGKRYTLADLVSARTELQLQPAEMRLINKAIESKFTKKSTK